MATKEEIKEVVAQGRLIDDTFMSVVFQKIECVQVLIDLFLPEHGFVVESVQTQTSLQNLHGRSARLDILAKDRNGRLCNIEIQRGRDGASPKRARYNSSLLDVNATNPGETYDQLPDTYTIFLSEHDVLKTNLPLCHVVRTIQETGEPFSDGSYILYVDTQNREDTPLGRLMADMYCRDVNEISNSLLREEVRYYKESEGGSQGMCELFEKLYGKELAAKDAEIAAKDAKIAAQKVSTFSALVKEGMSKEAIMRVQNLTEEEYEEMYKNLVK